jgi:hypothetical protein
MSTIIRTLDDVTLVPVPVRYYTNLGTQDRQEMRADLFDDLRDTYLTVVFGNISGDPVSEIARLRRAEVRPGCGTAPWQIDLTLRFRHKRSSTGLIRDFPTAPLILLRGEYALDFDKLDLPPIKARSGVRVHCASYTDEWRLVARHCVGVLKKKPERMLIDTTEAALQAHRERWPGYYMECAS